MIFTRSVSPKTYKAYGSYKPQLRRDFLNCCAYCLRQEYFFGGEAAGEIDHFKPQEKFPELETVYTNLYWSCGECNGNKSDDWPSAQQLASGICFVDPCADDPAEHFHFEKDGRIIPLSDAAEYTIDSLMLDQDHLNAWRREQMEAFEEVNRINARLANPRLDPDVRSEILRAMEELKRKLDPPVFNRVSKSKRNASRRALMLAATRQSRE